MIWPSECKVWNAAASPKANTPALEYVQVVRTHHDRGYIVAADNYILAALPCLLGQEEQVGLVRAIHLEMACTGLKNYEKPMLDIQADWVTINSGKHYGQQFARWAQEGDRLIRFPDWTALWPKAAYDHQPYTDGWTTIDPKWYSRLCLSLGQKYLRLWRFRYPGGKTDLYLYALDLGPDGLPIPPFGMMMGLYPGVLKLPYGASGEYGRQTAAQ